MSNARLGYQNLLEQGTVVASSENANFPVANAYDWLTSDFFKPAAPGTINIDLTLANPATADYFAFFNQNLSSLSGTIKLQYWDGSWVDCFSAISPTDNTPRFVSFTPQTSDKWRVVITCASIFAIACISFGEQLELEQGMYLNWTPPRFARASELITSRADGGAFLGRSVKARGISTSLIVQYASEAWMDANWLPLVRHIEAKGFFFIPDIVNKPDDAAFCWVEEAVPQPTYTHYRRYMGATIPIKGLVE